MTVVESPDALRPRRLPVIRWVVALAFLSVVAVGCGQRPVGDSVIPTTIAPSTTSGSSSVTTTTVSPAVSEQPGKPAISPKPQGEPSIELPGFESEIVDFTNAADPETGFVSLDLLHSTMSPFADVSGYFSYRVNTRTDVRTANGTEVSSAESRVSPTVAYYLYSGPDGETSEVLVDRDDRWVKEEGEWRRSDSDRIAPSTAPFIAPEIKMYYLSRTFDTLTFVDWELIEGVWYARYEASEEFVGAFSVGGGITDSSGDVWVSPDGFLHSYDIAYSVPSRNAAVETSWWLSDLGSVEIELPKASSPSPLTPTAEAVRDHLVSIAWDDGAFLGGQSFSWSGRTATVQVEGDGEESSFVDGSKEVLAWWGTAGGGDGEAQHWYVGNEDSKDTREEIVIGETSWRRAGTFLGGPEFVPGNTGWDESVVTPGASNGADTLLELGQRLFTSWGGPNLEYIGEEKPNGVPGARFRATVNNGGEPGFSVDATLDVWTDPTSRDVRFIWVLYSATIVEDIVVDDVVVGTMNRQVIFLLSEIGAEIDAIIPPV